MLPCVRLLQDARYFHSKLTGLKDIGAPSGMLETVVMEKSVPLRRSPFARRVSAIPAGATAIVPVDGSPRMGGAVTSSSPPVATNDAINAASPPEKALPIPTSTEKILPGKPDEAVESEQHPYTPPTKDPQGQIERATEDGPFETEVYPEPSSTLNNPGVGST